MIRKCPHCGLFETLESVTKAEIDKQFSEESNGVVYMASTTVTVARCQQCKELVLYTFVHGDFVDPADVEYKILYPQWRDFSAVPSGVRSEYEKAQRVKNIDVEFYALGLRRTLEALCIENGIPSGNLVQRLKALAGDKDLPAVFVDMADYLRNLGNVGAHVSAVGVYESDAVAATEFTEAILEYLYVAPAKLGLVKNELAQRQAQAKGN